jgi:hypothetical protein
MANFNTHITVAAAASGLMSVLCLQVGLVGKSEVALLALAGTVGGILPDVDLQSSYPSRILFSLMATLMAFAAVTAMGNSFSVLELWLVAGASFFVIRYPVWRLFHKYTRHRGSTHTVIAAFLSMFITATFVHHWLEYPSFIAWLVGSFVLFGFFVHLILDEIYSVDFSNRRIKRSFGTALKLWDSRKPVETVALIAFTILMWYISPDAQVFWDTFSDGQTYKTIATHLVPTDIEHLRVFFSSF